MVNFFRTMHLSVTALLLATLTFASPVPNPHTPQVGEIVHYDPNHGKMSSLFKSHKGTHITVGHDHQGHAILAPVVSHSQGASHPHTSAHGMGSLQGVVRLDHTVTADPKAIHHASGKDRGHVISKEHLERIQGGKLLCHALVHAHLTAAEANEKAHHAHLQAGSLHKEAAQRYRTLGHHDVAAHLEDIAKDHHASAERHDSLAKTHRASAHLTSGANPEELRQAQHSAEVASQSENAGHRSALVAKLGIAKAQQL